MILIVIGIAAAWLVVSIPCALLLVRAMTLNEDDERAERRERPVPQLQTLTAPTLERERERAA